MNRKLTLVILTLIACVGTVTYLNNNPPTPESSHAITGSTMGTTYHIKVIPPAATTTDITTLHRAIDARLSEIDHRMSTYKQDSELSQFNTATAQQWHTISPELLHVVQAGHNLSKSTAGAFDMTVGKLVNLWGFGPKINTDMIPPADKIAELQQSIGYQKLQIQLTPPAIMKQSDNLFLDLSAIAKGYAVDAIAQVILENNIQNFIVEIGGEIITHGHKKHNKPWVVGIETPAANTTTNKRHIQKKLYLHGVAMATSGDYRNYFDLNGIRYSHTIDPTTGYPIKHNLASVTVISDSCMKADGLATAFMVMGPEKALQYATENHIAIFLLIKDGGHFTEKQSLEFNQYLKQ